VRRLVLLASVLLVAGCATVHPQDPAGTGIYSYTSGRLSWTYPVALEPAWQATLRALKELNLRIESKTLDGLGGHIEALRSDNTKVSLSLKPATERTTRISVRVGAFGDRKPSEDIHAAIRTQLQL
jgi:uncharacterized protein YceK